MSVITRFAPSPTGFLHIGGARTALFNWLFAKHHEKYGNGGKFLLRIEDTDRMRFTDEAVQAILDGLSWLGLEWEGEAVSQYTRVHRHREVVEEMLASGQAYNCYCSPEELAEMRDRARAEGKKMLYDGRWRDRDPSSAPLGVEPVVRLKAPKEGVTVINDCVQGEVSVSNETIDDMVLLRADRTPTYMLAVVVDDHDMGITHVIRGDDHFTNAFRQSQIFNAMGWARPIFAHIPLILGADGSKLSKRHGALGVETYREMGFLADALCNYLLRLGWSHGDDEIILRNEAIEWFDLNAVNKAAARFDLDKLMATNAHYMQTCEDELLINLLTSGLAERIGHKLSSAAIDRVRKGLPGLRKRARTITELIEKSEFYAVSRPIIMDKDVRGIFDNDAIKRLSDVYDSFCKLKDWREDQLEVTIKTYLEKTKCKMKDVAQVLRVALTGTTNTPGICEILVALGRDEALGRIKDLLESQSGA
ncbi:MAG: glutamate--tRNA ligase [Magnetovibrio sp.]|nr:glutamate--tRNA ligase [Magnetovibrio sp.]